MNQRIKSIREHFDLSQEEFGDRIRITKSSVSRIESGINNPSDQTILLICSEFNVNEEWLRTGIGVPYPVLPTSDIIAKATTLLGEHDPMFESLIEVYSKLTDSNKKVLFQILKDFINKCEEKTKDSSSE